MHWMGDELREAWVASRSSNSARVRSSASARLYLPSVPRASIPQPVPLTMRALLS
jgi:hypothetical protein